MPVISRPAFESREVTDSVAVRLRLLRRSDLLDRLDRLKRRHQDPGETFAECEDIYLELLRASRPLLGGASPVLVLRGGLVAYNACRRCVPGPLGLVLPVRVPGGGVRIGYTDLPRSEGAGAYLLADWIVATGETLAASVEALRSISPATRRVVITSVIACTEGVERLDALPGVEIDLITLRAGATAGGLLLGFDIGDYALGNGTRARRTWMEP